MTPQPDDTEATPASRRSRRASFRWRLFFAVQLSVLTVSLLVLVVLSALDARTFQQASETNARHISNMLSQDLARLLLFNSPDLGADLISRMEGFSEIRQMRLYDRKGAPRFRYQNRSVDDLRPTPAYSANESIQIEKNRISVVHPVSLEGVQLGTVYLALSRQDFDSWVIGALKHLLWLIPTSLLLSVFIAMWVQRIIAAPILEFRDAIKAVGTEKDYGTPFPVPEDNEIGDLYRQFNELSATIGKTRDELREQRSAVENSALVARFDEQWKLTYCNGQFADAIGREAARLLDRPLAELPLFSECDESIRNELIGCERGRTWRGEIRVTRIGQQWLAATIVPQFRPSVEQREYLLIGFDISRRVALERDLRLARDQANAANHAKSHFLATMSHEIRTPMNGVIGMTELLLDTDLSDESREYANTIQRASESLLSIINDILDFSKVQAGMLRLDTVPYDLRSEIEDVCELLSENAARKGLELYADVPADLDSFVIGDPGRIRQVVINLLGNAIKFTERGEVGVRIREGNTAREGYAAYQIEVFDTGIGIPASKQAHIFDQFAQADESTTRLYGGTGLGLSISKALVELMGGHIALSSKLGEGSVFSFDVELKRDLELERTSPLELHDLNLLVVDDDPTNRDILVQHLETLGANVQQAISGQAALDLCRQRDFDGVITDYRMGPMDGTELAVALDQDSDGDKPWIILISSSDQEVVAGEKGIDAVLRKPLRLRTLSATLRLVTERYRGPASGSASVLNGHRFLVVDDQHVNQQVVESMLAALGCPCECASDGREALDILKNDRFDAIIMDCHMPDLDGLETTRIIRQEEQDRGEKHPQRILALTASVTPEDEKACLDAGMDVFLGKPFRRTDLEAKLMELMGLMNDAPTDQQTAG